MTDPSPYTPVEVGMRVRGPRGERLGRVHLVAQHYFQLVRGFWRWKRKALVLRLDVRFAMRAEQVGAGSDGKAVVRNFESSFAVRPRAAGEVI